MTAPRLIVLAAVLALAAPAPTAHAADVKPAAKPATVAAKPTPKPAPKAETFDDVRLKLETFAARHLQTCNAQMRPSHNVPEIFDRNGQKVARYVELDLQSLTTEISQTDNKTFAYLGKVIYIEHTYEAVGATPEEAKNGQYQRVRSRRLTELPRYVKGAWVN